MRINNLTLRTWQEKAVNRALHPVNKQGGENSGIFLEAAGGRGKTICALAIAQLKNANSVLILNKKLSILKGWRETAELFDIPNVECITDKTLNNRIKKGEKFNVDILIIDEWQDMCSKALIKTYEKIKRQFTIGLSATPIRRKGVNFHGLEKTIFGEAYPSNNWEWQTYWGKMVSDQWTATRLKWDDFRDYDTYIQQLPNFMDFDLIEELENAEDNNGYKLEFIQYNVPCANPELLKDFDDYNLVRIDGRSAMSKQSFGRAAFRRYLNQAGVSVDFPKLKAINKDTPTLLKIDELIKTAPYGLLIVSKSKQIVEIIKERNPEIDIWTGERKEDNNHKIMVATNQVMGVGVDGLQHRFQAIIVLDPVDKDHGEYDDYRQLLWRISGSRQQNDIKVIEFRYD